MEGSKLGWREAHSPSSVEVRWGGGIARGGGGVAVVQMACMVCKTAVGPECDWGPTTEACGTLPQREGEGGSYEPPGPRGEGGGGGGGMERGRFCQGP